jgi:hypothetical protein
VLYLRLPLLKLRRKQVAHFYFLNCIEHIHKEDA